MSGRKTHFQIWSQVKLSLKPWIRRTQVYKGQLLKMATRFGLRTDIPLASSPIVSEVNAVSRSPLFTAKMIVTPESCITLKMPKKFWSDSKFALRSLKIASVWDYSQGWFRLPISFTRFRLWRIRPKRSYLCLNFLLLGVHHLPFSRDPSRSYLRP